MVSTHEPLQSVVPLGHDRMHAPPAHTSPDAQVVPQPPQLVTLVFVSTQVPLHIVRPEVHAHAPPTQISPEAHPRPQAPQSLALVCVSVQAPPQSIWPVGHVHAPEVQLCPTEQAMSQPPQSVASVWVSTHRPPQSVAGATHSQEPLTHALVESHALPQEPQFASSLMRSTQPLPHAVPASHVVMPLSIGTPVSGTTTPPSEGGNSSITPSMQPSVSLSRRDPPSGICSPQGTSSSAVLRKRRDWLGFPGEMSTQPEQLCDGTSTSRAARFGDSRSRPSCGLVAAWQPAVAQRAAKTSVRRLSISVGQGRPAGPPSDPEQPNNVIRQATPGAPTMSRRWGISCSAPPRKSTLE